MTAGESPASLQHGDQLHTLSCNKSRLELQESRVDSMLGVAYARLKAVHFLYICCEKGQHDMRDVPCHICLAERIDR